MRAPVLPRAAARILLLAALVCAFAVRLPVGGVPPGLYHDEAYYGLDAAQVLAGHPALYFPANNGREPLFIHLVAAFIAVLGRTPAALRLASAFVGVATVAATFAAGRALVGFRAGLLAAWLCAVTPWPVLVSRAGFRAGTLPLVLALAVAASVVGWRRRDARWALGGGALAGLTLYTYTAARLVPLVFLLAGAWAWFAGPRPRPGRGWLGRWLLAAGLVAAPLLAWFALHLALAGGRAGEVSVLNPAIGGADPVGALARSAVATLGLLTARGDFIPRHNIPLRPVFGLLAGALALLGGLVALAWARRRPGALVVLIWAAVMALPTLLAEGAPHFLRAVGLLPAAMLLPALGAEGLADLAARRAARLALPVWALVAVLAVGAEAATTWTYLAQPATAGDALYFAFEAGATDLARDVNMALGTGWRGGWAEAPATPGARVWLDRRLRDGWASVPYLVPEDRVTLVDPYDPILTTLPGVAYLLPEALQPDGLWSHLASNLRLDITPGSTERGDLATTADQLYVRVAGAPALPATSSPPLAQFANGLTLLSSDVQPTPDRQAVDITTVWSADGPTPKDVTAFFQVLDHGTRVAGDDAVLGSGLYPTPRWRAGDQIVEHRRLTLPGGYDPARHTLIVGTYVAPATRPIGVVGPDGQVVGEHVVLR